MESTTFACKLLWKNPSEVQVPQNCTHAQYSTWVNLILIILFTVNISSKYRSSATLITKKIMLSSIRRPLLPQLTGLLLLQFNQPGCTSNSQFFLICCQLWFQCKILVTLLHLIHSKFITSSTQIQSQPWPLGHFGDNTHGVKDPTFYYLIKRIPLNSLKNDKTLQKEKLQLFVSKNPCISGVSQSFSSYDRQQQRQGY